MKLKINELSIFIPMWLIGAILLCSCTFNQGRKDLRNIDHEENQAHQVQPVQAESDTMPQEGGILDYPKRMRIFQKNRQA